jgi:hypothetical protein
MSLDSKLAAYILCLESCLEKTHRAEDRSIYVRYLADAAGLLAACVAGEPKPALASRVESHERLWGQTWLQDPIYREAAAAFGAAKEEISRAA